MSSMGAIGGFKGAYQSGVQFFWLDSLNLSAPTIFLVGFDQE
jgi:hypothetical protein